jgi:hypothetical protein
MDSMDWLGSATIACTIMSQPMRAPTSPTPSTVALTPAFQFEARLHVEFPVLSWCLQYLFGWDFASASGRGCARFLTHRMFIVSTVAAAILTGCGAAAYVQQQSSEDKVPWRPLGGLSAWSAPIAASVIFFGIFPLLPPLYPVMRGYEPCLRLESPEQRCKRQWYISAALLLPLVGTVFMSIVSYFVYESRGVATWPTITIATFVLNNIASVFAYAAVLPLVYCVLILMLVLHWQQARTLHKLIMQRSHLICRELDSRTPLWERLLLRTAPAPLTGSRHSQHFPPCAPRPPGSWYVCTGPSTDAQDANLSCRSTSRSSQTTCIHPCPSCACDAAPAQRDVTVDAVVLLHNAVRESVRKTARIWQVLLVAILIAVLVFVAIAVINVINGTAADAPAMHIGWMIAGPVVAVLLFGPVVAYNSVWPDLMGPSMDWSRWDAVDRLYLLSQLASPENKLEFAVFGFAMSVRDLFRVVVPLAATAAVSQLWNMRDKVLHPQATPF